MSPLTIAALLALAAADASVPPPPDAGACEVQLSVEATSQSNGDVVLVARATSLVDRDLALTLPKTCPAGAVRFRGARPGYDYQGNLCMVGACREEATRGRSDVPLAARANVVLGQGRISRSGNRCAGAVKPGQYPVSFEVDLQGARVCGPATVTAEVTLPAPKEIAPKGKPELRVPPKCPPFPACDLHCDGPWKKDARGCTICACEGNPGLEPPARPAPSRPPGR